MQIFRNKNLIFTLVAALVFSITAYFFYPSVSYAADITSLPADVDCTVEYDADTISFIYNDSEYSIDRHTDFSVDNNGTTLYPCHLDISYYPPNGQAYSDTLKLTRSSFGVTCYNTSSSSLRYSEPFNSVRNVSYWYSPSLNYVFCIADSKIVSFSSNYDYSIFKFSALTYFCNSASSYYYGFSYPLYIFDLNNSSYFYTFQIYSTVLKSSSGTVRYSFPVYGCSGDYTSTSLFYCPQFNSCDSYLSYYNGFSVYYYGKNGGNFGCPYTYYPSDLLCIFSTYDIPGFFEVSSDKLITPSYYFKYQYLYFKDDSGYIFIDSSEPLKGISRTTVGEAIISFNSTGNCHVYNSSDGITWNELTTIKTMYCSSFSVTYSYFYTGSTLEDSAFAAALVYCNDDTMEKEPQFKPTDFPNPTDIAGNLSDVTSSMSNGNFSYNSSSLYDTYCLEYPVDCMDSTSLFLKLFLSDTVYLATYSSPLPESTLSGVTIDDITTPVIHVLYFDSDFIYEQYTCRLSGSTSNPLNFTLAFINNDSSYLNSLVKVRYISMDSVQEISSPVAFLRLISSSTGNISQELLSLNTVFHSDLSSIHGNISSVVSALNTLDDDIKGICFDDSGIIKAIKSLDIPSFDDSGLIASINGAAFDDSAILDAINNISFNVSGGSVDVDPGLLGDLCDVFDDDGDDSNGLYTFVSDTLDDVSSSINFSEFITFSDDLMSGISFTNNLVGSIYNNLGDLKPVVLCGAGFTLVAIVLKKERAT